MSRKYEITKIEIAKLDLKVGDILVVKIIGAYPPIDVIEKIEEYLKPILPTGVKTIVYSDNQIDLSIISPEAPPNDTR